MAVGGPSTSEPRRRISHTEGPQRFVVWVLVVSITVLLTVSMALGRSRHFKFNSTTFHMHGAEAAGVGDAKNRSSENRMALQSTQEVPSLKTNRTDALGQESGEKNNRAETQGQKSGEKIAAVEGSIGRSGRLKNPEVKAVPVDSIIANASRAELEFGYQELHRMQCLRAVQERVRDDYRPILEKYTGGVALIDVAMHSNLGDNILWRGAVSLLAGMGISPGLVCSHSQPSWTEHIDNSFPKCDYQEIINVVQDKGLVMFHAGGNWGDLYRFVQSSRLKLLKQLSDDAKTMGFGILQLPQSIHYTPDSAHLAKDDEIMKGVSGDVTTMFVRSFKSFEFAKKHYPHIPVKLTPDIALVLGPLLPPQKPEFDVLIQFRQDKEAQEKDKSMWSWLDSKFKEANVTYKVQDWWYKADQHPREISSGAITVFSEVRTAAAMNVLSQGKVVITNRLHGSIVSTLMGKRLFYVDTKERKLKNVRNTAFSKSKHCAGENLHSVRMESMEAAVEGAINLLKSSGDDFYYN
ncbi:hypothetical protein BSKO_01979 [Bryopsis sp. KO-2023]|nr:hypothetical protein BSKO_01979 [Bryopsis sp. KO-2023]